MLGALGAEHRAIFSDLSGCVAPALLTLEGPEAHHLARVKRARVGESLLVLDGEGLVGRCEIVEIAGSRQRPIVAAALGSVERVDPVSPRVEVVAPAPKGDRLGSMLDALTQIGVASYRPLVSARSERDPGSLRTDKLERIVLEACKQCIRAHALEVGDPVSLDGVLGDADGIETVVCLGGSDRVLDGAEKGSERVRIVVGPEGGWSDEELARIGGSGARAVRLTPHVLRIETACVVASSIVLRGA